MKGMELSTLNKDQWVRFHTHTTGVRLPLLISLHLILTLFFFFQHSCALGFTVQLYASDHQEVMSSFLMRRLANVVVMVWPGRRITFLIRFPHLWQHYWFVATTFPLTCLPETMKCAIVFKCHCFLGRAPIARFHGHPSRLHGQHDIHSKCHGIILEVKHFGVCIETLLGIAPMRQCSLPSSHCSPCQICSLLELLESFYCMTCIKPVKLHIHCDAQNI